MVSVGETLTFTYVCSFFSFPRRYFYVFYTHFIVDFACSALRFMASSVSSEFHPIIIFAQSLTVSRITQC